MSSEGSVCNIESQNHLYLEDCREMGFWFPLTPCFYASISLAQRKGRECLYSVVAGTMANNITLPAGPSDLSFLGMLELCHLSSHTCKVACMPLFYVPVIQIPILCQMSILCQILF